MSGNSSPAKVRVLSSSGPHGIPARRRGDIGGPGQNQDGTEPGDAAAPGPVAAPAAPGRRLFWIAGATVLFAIGAAIGGLLVTVLLLYPDAIR